MVEVLIPNSIINRSLVMPDFNTSATTSVINYSRGMVVSCDVPEIDNSSEIKEKVLSQVEWYFSDENLLKDAFLMKHITRNKHGYVSLKLVASLRKIKAITKDCAVVKDAIRQSSSLELNEDSTKVRRINPVPDVDYSGIPKTIIITNYSSDVPDTSQVEQEYARYGEISQILVLTPGKAVPLSIKSCKTRFPCIGKEVCVLIEFATRQMAVKACKESQQNWRQTATVRLLSEPSQDSNGEDSDSSRSLSPAPIVEKKSKRKSSPPDQSSGSKSRGRPILKLSGKSGYDSGYSGVSRSPSSSPKSSPAPTRRVANSSFTTPKLSLKPVSPLVTVIRNPLGPDGTKGFASQRR